MITLDGTAGTIAGLAAGGLPNGTVQQADLATGVAATGPAFSAYQSVSQSIPDGTDTKVTLTTESLDSASCYDTSTSRFTPNVAGWYYINGTVSGAFSASNYTTVALRKNGSVVAQGIVSSAAGPYHGLPVAQLMYFNGTTDYAELYVYHDSTGAAASTTTGAAYTYFQGFLARAA